MTPTPPPSVVRDLALYDPGLRLRWGPATQLWYLEKQMDVRHPQLMKERPKPLGTSPRSQDLWDAWREGYVVVAAIHPSLCTSRVLLECLRNTDLNFHGSWDAINRRLDAIQEEQDKALDRALDTFVEAGSRELYDRDQWLGKRKIQVPNDAVTVERITPQEQHEGFVVNDRRVTV